jgi:NADH-quinone oxidoreductase subunit A
VNLANYFPVLLFIIVASVLGFVLMLAGSLIGPNKPDAEKLSPYESGFEAFGDARMRFDVRYYLVAILFILFDLEIAFLFPWAMANGQVGLLGFGTMLVFLLILLIGFAYEWKKGALSWE